MFTEIETKLKVDSLETVARILNDIGASFAGQKLQRDYYFDNLSNELAYADRCLRLRIEQSQNGPQIILTYKGAREKHQIKSRQEVELSIEDRDAAIHFLAGLGYEPVLVFEKKRQIWKIGNCEIALDELPEIGTYIEIEGENHEDIEKMQAKLELSTKQHIHESYAFFVRKHLKSLNSDQTTLFFDDNKA